jgi:hypothetical protein
MKNNNDKLLKKDTDTAQARRLVRLYKWVRFEKQHGNVISCGGIFPVEEVKAGQKWQGAPSVSASRPCPSIS